MAGDDAGGWGVREAAARDGIGCLRAEVSVSDHGIYHTIH